MTVSFFFLIDPRPPISTLFPYTTLFRSRRTRRHGGAGRRARCRLDSRSYPVRRLSRRARRGARGRAPRERSEEHTSELQSHSDLVCRLLLEKKKTRQESAKEKSMKPTAA